MKDLAYSKRIDVLIIDYGVGNILSITNALDYLGYTYLVSSKVEDIKEARAYILPGVGAFNEAMNNLHKLGIVETLHEEVVVNKKPILSICLGMQVMAESSEENGFHKGLGWIPGRVVKIKGNNQLKVPHVGWNDVKIKKRNPLFSRNEETPHFYFDHSYHFICDTAYIAATCIYGEEVTAAVQNEHIFGVQFHPEKSQNNGLKLYRSFFKYIKERDYTC